MNYFGEDELIQGMGIGYLGEVRQGPDGKLYQWVQGVDGLGNPVGFWRRLRRRLRRLARRALPLVQRFAPFVPGGAAVAAGLRVASPYLRRAGVAGYPGLGALYQAPDGSVYEVAGFAQDEMPEGIGQDEELGALAEDELTQGMGAGYLGEIRQGPDGNLYQWVQGVDGLGNPVGFWRSLRRRLRRLARRALPLVQRFAPLVPGGAAVAAGLRVASPYLRRAGVGGTAGLGALYQAPDGTLYQVQGLAQDEELQGFAEGEELQGLDEDEDVQGFAEGEELRGFAEDEEMGYFSEDELDGFGEEEELTGYGADEELEGYGEDEELGDLYGYVKDERVSGLEAFVPDKPAGTRMFTQPAQPPEIWKALW